jgi:hypothetical protein
VYDLRKSSMTLFKQGKDKLSELADDTLPSLDCDLAKELFGAEREQAINELVLPTSSLLK